MAILGYMILILIVGAYAGLVIDDYIQTIKRSSMKGREIANYVILRGIRDAMILAGILFLFHVAGLGLLDKYF